MVSVAPPLEEKIRENGKVDSLISEVHAPK